MPWTDPAITFGPAAPAPAVLPTATSYVAVGDADLYFATTLKDAEWTALTPAEKDAALTEATKWLETLCYKGEVCGAQELKWPRKIEADHCCPATDCTSIPVKLLYATCELALQLFKNQTAMIGNAATGTTGAIQSQTLGDLSQSFYDVKAGASSSRFGPTSPLVLQRFEWLGDLLGCYMRATYGSSRILQRVRS